MNATQNLWSLFLAPGGNIMYPGTITITVEAYSQVEAVRKTRERWGGMVVLHCCRVAERFGV